jgi:hypothetical protein
MVTTTQGISSKGVFLPNPKISLLILDKLEESRFWRKRGKSTKSKGLEAWIYSQVGGR